MAFCEISRRKKVASYFLSSCWSCLFVMRNAGRSYRFLQNTSLKQGDGIKAIRIYGPGLAWIKSKNLFSSKTQGCPENRLSRILIPDVHSLSPPVIILSNPSLIALLYPWWCRYSLSVVLNGSWGTTLLLLAAPPKAFYLCGLPVFFWTCV